MSSVDLTTVDLPVRRHPDLFTAQEAAQYLHLDDPDAAERTLATFRDKYGLRGEHMGRCLMYHREALDRLVCQLFGKPIENRRGK